MKYIALIIFWVLNASIYYVETLYLSKFVITLNIVFGSLLFIFSALNTIICLVVCYLLKNILFILIDYNKNSVELLTIFTISESMLVIYFINIYCYFYKKQISTKVMVKKSVVNQGIQQNSEKNCSICLDDECDKQYIRTNCNHIFHEECINNWSQINNNCPYCKSILLIQ